MQTWPGRQLVAGAGCAPNLLAHSSNQGAHFLLKRLLLPKSPVPFKFPNHLLLEPHQLGQLAHQQRSGVTIPRQDAAGPSPFKRPDIAGRKQLVGLVEELAGECLGNAER
jgi:hypothetical protein